MKLSRKDRKKVEEKCAFSHVNPDQLEDNFQEALANDYVDSVRRGRLVYTKDFYKAMHKKISEGMTYVQAYQALGFNVEALGTDRANAAGKRAEQMAADGTLNKHEIGDYPGDIPMDKMKNLKQKDLDGYLAYLEGRCIYLEAALDVEKEKKRLLFQEKYSELKKAGKIK